MSVQFGAINISEIYSTLLQAEGLPEKPARKSAPTSYEIAAKPAPGAALRAVSKRTIWSYNISKVKVNNKSGDTKYVHWPRFLCVTDENTFAPMAKPDGLLFSCYYKILNENYSVLLAI